MGLRGGGGREGGHKKMPHSESTVRTDDRATTVDKYKCMNKPTGAEGRIPRR